MQRGCCSRLPRGLCAHGAREDSPGCHGSSSSAAHPFLCRGSLVTDTHAHQHTGPPPACKHHMEAQDTISVSFNVAPARGFTVTVTRRHLCRELPRDSRQNWRLWNERPEAEGAGPGGYGVPKVHTFGAASDQPAPEAEGSGAAPVLVVAYNHFAVEFLLLLLERIFHLLPLQSSIPGERVKSPEELQVCTVRNYIWGCSELPRGPGSCPRTSPCQGTLQNSCGTALCQELCPRPLSAARQPRQKGELLQHPHSRARGVPPPPHSGDLSARKRRFPSSTHSAEQHRARTRASQGELQSQNKALVPSTPSRSEDWSLLQKSSFGGHRQDISRCLHNPTLPSARHKLNSTAHKHIPGPRTKNPGTRKRNARLDSPEQIHEASLPGNG